MDRGIPTEQTFERRRARGIVQLGGAPQGCPRAREKDLRGRTWVEARESGPLKLIAREGEFQVQVESRDRGRKERSMRRRRLGRRRLQRRWARRPAARPRGG